MPMYHAVDIGLDWLTFISNPKLEPPDADPHVRWCGRGGAVRLPPIPIKSGSNTSSRPEVFRGLWRKIASDNDA